MSTILWCVICFNYRTLNLYIQLYSDGYRGVVETVVLLLSLLYDNHDAKWHHQSRDKITWLWLAAALQPTTTDPQQSWHVVACFCKIVCQFTLACCTLYMSKYSQGSQEQEVKFKDQIFSKFRDIFVGFTRLKTQKMHVFLGSQILISQADRYCSHKMLLRQCYT